MILNQLDFGGSHPWQAPVNGQMIGTAVVEGQATIGYARGSILRRYSVTFWAKAWQGIGGQTANSMAALRYLLKQGEELADNRDLNPVYIQWSSSAETGAPLNAADQHDGWYNIESFKPDYLRLSSGLVPVQMTVALVATAPPRGLGQSYFGGALSTNYSGASQIAVGYPFNAANQAATAVSRTGGEGAIPLSVAPAANFNPLPFTPSATLGDWWKGGCRVFDTINTGSNAVPLAGLFVNANWVEVFAPDHRFEGDCWITNGLLGLLFQTGQARVPRVYLWSTAQSTPGWLLTYDVTVQDNTSNFATLRNYKVERIGLEEVRIVTDSSTSIGNWEEVTIRLQRGQYFARLDWRLLTQANTNQGLSLAAPANQKIVYNSGRTADSGLDAGAAVLAVQTDYGYGAAFINSTTYPFLYGWLYQNEPNVAQANGQFPPNLYHGDSAGPAQNAVRSYGFFAVPFGTSTTTTDKLQVEAERGTYGSWVQVADAAASGGQAEKLPSGTLINSGLDFSAAQWQPPSGTYGVWFRVRVTSAAGSTGEMSLGVKNYTDSTTTLGTFAANQTSTSYVWVRAVASWSPTAGKNYQVYAVSAATLGTDWFIDEVALVPQTLSTANTGPQELWQQFLMDRTVRLTRL